MRTIDPKIKYTIIGIILLAAVLLIPWFAAETLVNRFGTCEYNIGSTDCVWGPIRTQSAYCSNPNIYVFGIHIKEGSSIDDCGINALDEVEDDD